MLLKVYRKTIGSIDKKKWRDPMLPFDAKQDKLFGPDSNLMRTHLESQRREKEERLRMDFEWRSGVKDSRDGRLPQWHTAPYKMGYESAGGFRPTV